MMIRLEPISIKRHELLEIAIQRNKVPETLRSSTQTPLSSKHQEKWVNNMSQSDKYFFIYKDTEDRLPVFPYDFYGYCGLDKIHPANLTAEISLLVVRAYTRCGYGSQAVSKLLEIAFNELHLNCVYGECYHTSSNWDFWRKCGFVAEGELKERKWWDGMFYNSTMFSMTKCMWEEGND